MAVVVSLDLGILGIGNLVMGSSKVYNQIREKIRTGSSLDLLSECLEKLNILYESGELSLEERYQLQYFTFDAMRELTLNEPNAAKPIILDRLLPYCTIYDEEERYWLSRHRVCISQWLEQYPEHIKKSFRAEVLLALLPHYSSSNPQAACWTASVIGYRDDQIVSALWNLVKNDTRENGDVALTVMTFLGIEPDFRQDVISELHKRIANHFNRHLCSAATNLAEPVSLDVIFEYWLASDRYSFDSFEMLVILATVRDVLNEHSEDIVFQDRIWMRLKDLAKQKPPDFSKEIYRRDLVSSCNSPSVIPELCTWVIEYSETTDNPANWRWVTGLTLEDCVKPRQLSGWQALNANSVIIEGFREDACQDTGRDIFATTAEDRQKKVAWGVVLSTGYLDALDWFNEAVGHETGKLVQASIMELFACFRIEPLPEVVEQLIVDLYDAGLPDDDSRELSRRLSAVHMAKSSASNEAFQILLDFGLTFEGKVLRQSSIALAEVAVALARNDNKDIEKSLVNAVIERKEAHQSEAAAFALEHVVSVDGSLLSEKADSIVALLADENRQEYERSTLLTALSKLPNWVIPGNLWSSIKEWAKEPNKWLGGASLEILAREGILQNREELLVASLGLERINEKWDVSQAGNHFDWAPYFVGLLYQRDQESFLPAVVSLIKNEEWFPDQIIWWLRDIKSSSQESLPPEIENALIQRVYMRQSSAYSEPEIFDVLAELAPEALVKESWMKVWENWLHSARVGLADTLGKINLSNEHQNYTVELLQRLCLDSHFAVRRSAYRGLMHQSHLTLFADCSSWADSSVVELNTRAAEAYGWLDYDNEDFNAELQELQEKLQTHRERTVRETIKRTLEEFRRRSWARDYETIVKSVKGDSNEEIANAWCYGEALANIGDDSTLDGLRAHLQNELPSNVRFWIKRIIKNLEKNWQKTVEKWPDAWFPWKGTVEQGEGAVFVGEKKILGQYSIWHKRASIPGEFKSWGGAIRLVTFAHAGPRKINRIRLANGAEGQIVTTRISNDLVIFVGSGHFPSASEEIPDS